MLLSQDWSEKLNGYFSTDWAHLWLPLKGHPKMIRIDRERYLKHTVIDLETLNEPSSTEFPMLGKYSYDFDFGNFTTHISDIPSTQNFEMIFQIDVLVTSKESILCQYVSTKLVDNKVEIEKITRHEEVRNSSPQICTLYFYGS
jgi:hypothetical protein